MGYASRERRRMTSIEAKIGALTGVEQELTVGDKLLDLDDLRG